MPSLYVIEPKHLPATQRDDVILSPEGAKDLRVTRRFFAALRMTTKKEIEVDGDLVNWLFSQYGPEYE